MKRTALVLAALAFTFVLGAASRPTLGVAYRTLVGPRADPTTPVPRAPHRHAAFLWQLERAPAQVPAILFGDSITEGWSLVPAIRDETFGIGCLNFGVGWDCTEHVLWRVQNGELGPVHISPRVVVVHVGTNNLVRPDMRSDAPDDVARGVAAVVSAVQERQPAARVVLLGLLPRGAAANDPLRAKVAATNVLLARIPGVEFVDGGHVFLVPDGSIELALMPDAVHPSPEGYHRWGKVIAPHVRR